LAPVGGLETDLVQAIAADRWTLNRGVSIEGSIYAIGVGQPSHGTSGDPQVDVALAQARVWLSEGKNLQLLSLYQHRIQRRVEKNKKMLDELQQQRQAALQRVAEEVSLLTQLAESKGETYDIARDYPRQAFPRNLIFQSRKSPASPPTSPASPKPKSSSRRPQSPSAGPPKAAGSQKNPSV